MTSAPAVDERKHRDAVAALLTAALGVDSTGSERVFDYGTVPGADGNAGVLPNIYVLVQVERRGGVGVRRGGRVAGRSGWRVSVRFVGRTVNEARWAGWKVAEALDEVRLTVAGAPAKSTGLEFESTDPIVPDDGRFSGRSVFIYAL